MPLFDYVFLHKPLAGYPRPTQDMKTAFLVTFMMPTGGITAYFTPINAWREAYVNDDEINERIDSDVADEQPHPFGNAFADNYSDEEEEEVEEDSDEVLPPRDASRARTWDAAARQRKQRDNRFRTSWLRLYPWLSLRRKDPMGQLALPADYHVVGSDLTGSIMASRDDFWVCKICEGWLNEAAYTLSLVAADSTKGDTSTKD